MASDSDFDINSFKGTFSKLFRSWAIDEQPRMIKSSDGTTTSQEKLRAAARAFTGTRSWPAQVAPGAGPRFIWDIFMYYTGITSDCDWPQFAWSDDDDDEPEINAASAHADITYWSQAEDDRLKWFLCETAKATSVFLSSYSRRIGLIYNDSNIDSMAIVLEFFLKFLLRNDVLPENERAFKCTLKIIEIAKKELPATVYIARTFPDPLSQAFINCWGLKDSGFVLAWNNEGGDILNPPHSDTEAGRDTSDHTGSINYSGRSRVEATSPGEECWEGGWPWNTLDLEGSIVNDDRNDSVWLPLKRPDLETYLGPRSISSTHFAGLVEKSIRQIKNIIYVSGSPSHFSPEQCQPKPDFAAAEHDLDRRFAKVVLQPMRAGWDEDDIGRYATPELTTSPSHPPSLQYLHNPATDDITVLIEPTVEVLDSLCVGMGLGGTWINIMRESGNHEEGQAKAPSTYWYMEDLTVVVPSFWTTRS